MPDTVIKIVDEWGLEDHIRISETHTGKGIFATRLYPATAVIGEILGNVIRDDSYGSEYSFDLENGCQIEPFEPFRFVNHSCDPNCEFDWMDDEGVDGRSVRRAFMSAIRDIQEGEQLTIEYNWSASWAIPCDCRSPLCRGWVVASHELGTLKSRLAAEEASFSDTPSDQADDSA